MTQKSHQFTEFFRVNSANPKKGRLTRVYEESTMSQALADNIASKQRGISMALIWNNLTSKIKPTLITLSYILNKLKTMVFKRNWKNLKLKGGKSAFK